MKSRYFSISVLLIISSLAIGQNKLPIYNKVNLVKEVETESLGENQLFISSPFGKPDLSQITPEMFRGKKIKKISYLYSHNNENPSFGQNELSNRRYSNLMKKLDGVDLNNVDWETKVQVGCGNIPCSQKLDHGFIIELEPESNQIEKELGHHQLETQKKTINASVNNSITGKEGTKVTIPSGAFVDAFGNEVIGNVDVELKEAITTEAIVLANLSTVTNKGETLQSKGMIELKATFKGNEVYVKDGKELEVTVPIKFEEGYSFFEGEQKEGKLVWGNPVPIVQNVKVENDNIEEKVIVAFPLGQMAIRDNIMFVSASSYQNQELIKFTVNKGNAGYDISKKEFNNSSFDRQPFAKSELDSIQSWFDNNFAPLGVARFQLNNMNSNSVVGVNMGGANQDLVNTFRMKKLGWANIDCLTRGNNIKKIRYNVAQNEVDSLDNFSISLIVPSKNIFIPGYEKKDGNYSFTHGDNEDTALMPVGEHAFIIAMGDKEGQTYFQMKEVKIGEREIEELAMKATEKEKALSIIKETL